MERWASSLSLELYSDPWKVKKVLKTSDTSSYLNKLVLHVDQVEDLVLPVLSEDAASNAQTAEGTILKFWDVDTESLHHLVFKQMKSYIIKGNWTKDFIRRRNLKAGDEIGLQWDPYKNRFNFSVLKRA